MPVCTECGRKTLGTRETCQYCGGAMALEAKAHISCPRCTASMRRDMVDEIELDLCDSCGGTWYDRGELEQHIEAAGPAEEIPAAADREFKREADRMDTNYLKCPICAGPMTRKNWGRLSGVIVDICGPHGLFLDAGELEKIQNFETSGTKARADRLEDWERRQGESERRREETRVRKTVQREMRSNRLRLWGLFR